MPDHYSMCMNSLVRLTFLFQAEEVATQRQVELLEERKLASMVQSNLSSVQLKVQHLEKQLKERESGLSDLQQSKAAVLPFCVF